MNLLVIIKPKSASTQTTIDLLNAKLETLKGAGVIEDYRWDELEGSI